MKKLTLIFCVILAFCNQASAQDFALLEILIDNHKTLSTKLRNRTAIEAANAVQTAQVEENTTSYKEVVKKISKRMEGALQNVQFAADVAMLTTKAVKVTKRAEDVIDYASDLALDYPAIILEGINVVDRIGEQVATVVKLAGMVVTNGVGVSLATNEQRMQFCWMIRQALNVIESELYSYETYCWVVSCNNDSMERIMEILKGWHDKGAFDKTIKAMDRLKIGIL